MSIFASSTWNAQQDTKYESSHSIPILKPIYLTFEEIKKIPVSFSIDILFLVYFHPCLIIITRFNMQHKNYAHKIG